MEFTKIGNSIKKTREQAIYLAVLSRFLIFILQLVANLIPDHDADAFKPDVENSTNIADRFLRNIFDGFNKWDSKYFLYVAEHGYTFENLFAFFPLFPLTTSATASVLMKLFPFLSFHSCCILSATSLNISLFTGAAAALYDLTESTFQCHEFAFLSTVAFSFNPASIFFTASYTESMFAFCVFRALSCISRSSKNRDERISFSQHFKSSLWFMLASLTRSNGTANAGFVAHSYLTQIIKVFKTKKFNIISYNALQCVLMCSIIVLPFLSFNFFAFIEFCADEDWFVYSQSCSNNPSWCHNKLPFIYDYIQKENWGLGLFAYYKWRKLPNFILAFPVVARATYSIILYCIKHSKQCVCLGLPVYQIQISDHEHNLMFLSRNIFCFIVHSSFLVIFSMLFMHVEVTTRMFSSSTPLLYWVAASYLKRDLKSSTSNLNTWKRLGTLSKSFVVYFSIYFVVGTILHVNFFPWT